MKLKDFLESDMLVKHYTGAMIIESKRAEGIILFVDDASPFEASEVEGFTVRITRQGDWIGVGKEERRAKSDAVSVVRFQKPDLMELAKDLI